jgi:aryl-alcohol dehydrogenase-like predicted oxidoreductase
MYHQTELKTTQLGQTGLKITRIGFGAWALGSGDWEHGWGPQDDDESIAAIHHALEQGINWIDTAAAYGFGRSEQMVGRALEGVADRPYVFTKRSLLEGPDRTVAHSLKRDSILREAGDSLRRLGVDAISTRSTGRTRPPIPRRGGRRSPSSKSKASCRRARLRQHPPRQERNARDRGWQ